MLYVLMNINKIDKNVNSNNNNNDENNNKQMTNAIYSYYIT